MPNPRLLSALMAGCALVLLSQLAMAVPAKPTGAADNTSHCPPFESSPLYRQPSNVVTADPSNWLQVIQSAAAGDEILLDDGTYHYQGLSLIHI